MDTRQFVITIIATSVLFFVGVLAFFAYLVYTRAKGLRVPQEFDDSVTIRTKVTQNNPLLLTLLYNNTDVAKITLDAANLGNTTATWADSSWRFMPKGKVIINDSTDVIDLASQQKITRIQRSSRFTRSIRYCSKLMINHFILPAQAA